MYWHRKLSKTLNGAQRSSNLPKTLLALKWQNMKKVGDKPETGGEKKEDFLLILYFSMPFQFLACAYIFSNKVPDTLAQVSLFPLWFAWQTGANKGGAAEQRAPVILAHGRNPSRPHRWALAWCVYALIGWNSPERVRHVFSDFSP